MVAKSGFLPRLVRKPAVKVRVFAARRGTPMVLCSPSYDSWFGFQTWFGLVLCVLGSISRWLWAVFV